MGNLSTQAIIQNILEIPITQTVQSVVYCKFDPEIYLLLKIGIVQMATTDFDIHASQPILDKKFDSIMKFINNFHDTVLFFLNWDSLHARLNSHYRAWNYKKKRHKKIKAYRKSLYKEPTVNMYLLILDLKPFRLQVKGKHSIGKEFESPAVQGKKLLTQTSF